MDRRARRDTHIPEHVTLPDSCKHEVYAVFSAADDIVVADRAFYAGKMARSVNHNFYLILSISSILVTVALFLWLRAYRADADVAAADGHRAGSSSWD